MASKLVVACFIALVCAVPVALAEDSASQAFIKKAIEGNLAEIALGQLAQQKAAAEPVRQFGRMLMSDHSQANDKAKQAATSMGVAPPTQPSAEQQATFQKLSGESGADFDRDFVAEMVKDHEHNIAEFQKEANEAKDAASQYATDTLPTLQKHLSMAQSLATTSGSNTPPANPAPAPTTAAKSTTEKPPIPGANSFTEGQAKSRIESAGFSDVTGLTKDNQGIWRGKATKNGAAVSVSLDFKGNVTAE